MGLPEKTAVGVLALGATALVVCGLFFCGEAEEIQEGIEATFTPVGIPMQLSTDVALAKDGTPVPYDLPQPPDCPPAIVDDLEAPLATRARPEGGRPPCTWYQRKGLKPVWMVRAPAAESADRHLADRTIPEIRVTTPLPGSPASGPRPGQMYRIRAGDTLPAIAHEAYGDLARWTDIWLANSHVVKDGFRLVERLEIWIPE